MLSVVDFLFNGRIAAKLKSPIAAISALLIVLSGFIFAVAPSSATDYGPGYDPSGEIAGWQAAQVAYNAGYRDTDSVSYYVHDKDTGTSHYVTGSSLEIIVAIMSRETGGCAASNKPCSQNTLNTKAVSSDGGYGLLQLTGSKPISNADRLDAWKSLQWVHQAYGTNFGPWDGKTNRYAWWNSPMRQYARDAISQMKVTTQSGAASNTAGMVTTVSGKGYWIYQADGGVFTFGDAKFYNSAYGKVAAGDSIVGMASTSTGKGYWLVSRNGAVYAFGDAKYEGGANTISGRKAIMAIAAHGTNGYWLLGADGGVFTYGSAAFHGSAAGHLPNGLIPAMSINPTSSGNGYRITDLNGGIYDFGDAAYKGGANTVAGHKAIMSMSSRGTGQYIQLAIDGGVYTYGVAFHGSMAGRSLVGTPVTITLTSSGNGYWIMTNAGAVYSFGDAQFYGGNNK